MVKPCPAPRYDPSVHWLRNTPDENLGVEALKRKRRQARYWNFRNDLLEAALEAGFEIPKDYFEVTFYMPIGKSYRPKKRAEMMWRPHTSAPDIDNLFKAFLDALAKRDQFVYDVRIRKFWVDHPTGYIQIEHE